MSDIAVREVTMDDVIDITKIYNHYVENTTITFDLVLSTEEEMAERIKGIMKTYPFLVITEDDEVVGFAYASQWKDKAAYQFCAETTIYLHPNAVSKGLGLRLYNALLAALPLFDIATVIGCITIPNPESIALHEKLGFKKVGEFDHVGFKFEKWINVGYWQKHILG
jgi:L-amino acid N-acyltransferase YncA